MRLPSLWYHGDTSLRASFRGQRWDRKRNETNLNAEGPGLYFTSSQDQARGYAAPSGAQRRHLRREARPPPGSFDGGSGAQVPRPRRLFDLARNEDQYVFVTNFGLEPDPFSKREMAAAKAEVLSQYRGGPFDVALALYHDLYRFDATAWVEAMVACGVKATLIERKGLLPKAMHCVVYDLGIVDVVATTAFVTSPL